MSVLTKTALTYSGVFGILLIFVMPLVGTEDMISKTFSGMGKALWTLIFISGIWAFLFEILNRKVKHTNKPYLSLQVSVIQIAAQIFMVLYLIGTIVKNDKWGLSYVLFALAMLYTVMFLKKQKKDRAFWFVNVSCTIVISCVLLTFLFVVELGGQFPSEFSEQVVYSLLKIVLCCLIFGIASYINYRQLVREK